MTRILRITTDSKFCHLCAIIFIVLSKICNNEKISITFTACRDDDLRNNP